MQILGQNFKAIGIETKINLMTQTQWFDQAYKGTLPGTWGQLHWVNTYDTPYDYFFGILSQESYVPLGTNVSLTNSTNYERYMNPQASALLKQFRQTSDSAQQTKLMHQVEALWLKDLPMIPVVYSADWSTYSTKNFTGWPTNTNRYTSSSVNDTWARLKVWTSLKPVQ